MFDHPERFIQEKLSKRVLSANTVRDLILAAFLVALQKSEMGSADLALSEGWLEEKSIEIREKASWVFKNIGAPFEYATRLQMEKASDILMAEYAIEKLAPEIQYEFNQCYQLILSKFSDPL